MSASQTARQTVGVVVFPGSNCDQDCIDAVQNHMERPARLVWHGDTDLSDYCAIILPGGFSYGDYLRSGAISRFSPVMQSVVEFANAGRPVLGICNGFQVLTEAHLLPGALMRNKNMAFICEHVRLTVEQVKTPFTSAYTAGESILLPVAHADGNYTADADTVKALEDGGQVVFRYAHDINGSVSGIAGICNAKGNVLGMMPHPERNMANITARGGIWNADGRRLFESFMCAAFDQLAAV